MQYTLNEDIFMVELSMSFFYVVTCPSRISFA